MPLQAQVTSATLKTLQETREWLVKGNDVAAPKAIWVFDREVGMSLRIPAKAHASFPSKGPHIESESDASDNTHWEFEEQHIIPREENPSDDTFATLRGLCYSAY